MKQAMRIPAVRCWSVVPLLLAAGPVASQTFPVVGQSTVTVSELRYRLVDLDLADGIAPSLTFAPNAGTEVQFYMGYTPGEPGSWRAATAAGHPFAPQDYTLKSTTGDTVFSSQSGVLKADVTLRLYDEAVNKLLNDDLEWGHGPTGSLAASYGGHSYFLSNGATLSANTALEIDAVVTYFSTADLAPVLNNAALMAQLGQRYDQIGASLTSSARLEIRGSQAGEWPLEVTSHWKNTRITMTLDDDGNISTEHEGEQGVLPVALRYENRMSVSEVIRLDTTLSTAGSLMVAVPEPGAVAMSAGGLALAGWVARRRRAAKQGLLTAPLPV